MSKLIYVYGDDTAMLDTLLSSLRAHGYVLEYATVEDKEKMGNVTADVALCCHKDAVGNTTSMGGLILDHDNRSAKTERGEPIHFTPMEFAMLSYLLQNASRAVSRGELLSSVWHFDGESGTRVTDDTVKRVRKKLAGTRLRIDTIWGYGFKIGEE